VVLGVLGVLLGPGAAGADSAPPELAGREGVRDERELVFTASKRLERTAETPAIVQVLTARDLWQRGVRTIHEALAYVAGFEIVAGKRVPFTFTHAIPGSVLVLLDGVALNGPYDNLFGTSLDFGTSLLFVNRIEVITSPGGVLWGGNTFVGIVNIVTQDALSSPGVHGRLGGGTFDYFEAGASAGFNAGPVEVYVAANAVTVRDPSVYVTNSPLDETTMGNRGRVDPGREYYVDLLAKARYRDLTLTVRHPFEQGYYSISELGARLPGNFQGSYSEPRRVYALAWQPWFLDRQVGLSITLRHLEVAERFLDREYPPSSLGAYPLGLQRYITVSSTRSGIDAEARLALPWRNDLILGSAYSLEQSFDAQLVVAPGSAGEAARLLPLIPDFRRHVGALYAHDVVRLNRWLTLTAGVRWQKATDYATTQGSGGLAFSPVRRVTLKVNYAQGFRPPPLQYNAGPDKTPTLFRPAPLVPETSGALQSQIDATLLENVGPLRRVRAQIAYTYNRVDNLIVATSQDRSNIITVFNSTMGTVAVHSVDGRLDVAADRFSLWLSASHNTVVTGDVNQFLTSLPASASTLISAGGTAVLWLQPRVELFAATRYVSGIPEALNPRPDATQLDAGLHLRRLPGGFEVSVVVRNLNGSTVAQTLIAPVPVPQPGRSAFARLSWTWR
jgi:outer membrane receptor protein involved in Fe transport